MEIQFQETIDVGTIKFSSSETSYTIDVKYKEHTFKFYATVVKNNTVHFVSNTWCASKHEEEYRILKRSAKKKIKKLIEETVNLTICKN
jgi:hypothetical protein